VKHFSLHGGMVIADYDITSLHWFSLDWDNSQSLAHINRPLVLDNLTDFLNKVKPQKIPKADYKCQRY